jgi:hypothetical protein
MNEIQEFLKALHDTANSAGIKIISDDRCCKLLAWLHAYGGGCEAVTQNIVLVSEITEAQKRLNLFGGNIPNKELYSLLKKYLSEVEPYVKRDKSYIEPEWVLDIFKKYSINKPK